MTDKERKQVLKELNYFNLLRAGLSTGQRAGVGLHSLDGLNCFFFAQQERHVVFNEVSK